MRLVGLSASPADHLARGVTPEVQSDSLRRIAEAHGMPIDTRVRPRMAGTIPACRAVVAARLNAPERAGAVLRGLRVRFVRGELLDEPRTIEHAAADAGLEAVDLARWIADEATAATLADDMAAARHPMPAALVLDGRLAAWEGGRRYTCPSYEIERLSDGERIAVPGFQPFAVYEVVMANLLPDVRRAKPPRCAEEVLRWAGTPLATKEVAVVRDISVEAAREELGRVAVEEPLGADGLWSLPA